jgi:hypothetical protein
VPSISAQRNATDLKTTVVDEKPDLKDFYNNYDPLAVTEADKQRYFQYLSTLTPQQQQRLNGNLNFYELSLHNVGGLVMPVVIQMTYEDGSQELSTIPAEIWRKNNEQVSKIIITPKNVVSFVIDPYQQTADTDLSNNAFPRQAAPTRFELFQQGIANQPKNPMQQAGTAATPGTTTQPAPASPIQQREKKQNPTGGK